MIGKYRMYEVAIHALLCPVRVWARVGLNVDVPYFRRAQAGIGATRLMNLTRTFHCGDCDMIPERSSADARKSCTT